MDLFFLASNELSARLKVKWKTSTAGTSFGEDKLRSVFEKVDFKLTQLITIIKNFLASEDFVQRNAHRAFQPE